MQSGKKNTKKWIVKPIEEENTRSVDDLMGWVSSDDTSTQLKFEFATKEAAIDFATKSNFEYEVFEPQISTLKHKSYTENFTK